MKFELVRFYYSPEEEPDRSYHTDNEQALEQLETLRDHGVDVEIFNVNELEDVFPHYHRATVGPKVALRPVFGTKGALEEDFGRAVPALVCYAKKEDLYPAEVFPRMDRALDRMLGINEVLDNLVAYGEAVAPPVEAPIPDEVELEPSPELGVQAETDALEEPAEILGQVAAEEAWKLASELDVPAEAEAAARPGAAPVAAPAAEERPTVAPPAAEEVVVPVEPRFVQPPPPPPVTAPAPAPQRDGCLGTVVEWLVLLFLGTLLATTLTLGILYALNGTLDFSHVRGVRSAETAIAELQSWQTRLTSDVNALEGEADRLSQSLANLEAKANTLEDYAGTIRNELEAAKTVIETTSNDVATLKSDVKAVATESAQFDAFLTRLRDVLIDIQGMPVATATPTPTDTSTPTVTPADTPTASPTVTVRPTSTLQQTPSPLATATPTVELTPTATSSPEMTPTP